MVTSFYSDQELEEIGFQKIGKNVLISKKTSIYGASKISIGDNVRIDDYCVMSGKIEIGNFVHIAVYCAIFGGDSGVIINDFAGLSSRCVIYAESDDYSGNFMTNPTVPEEYLGIITGTVELGKHAILGSGTTVLPGAIIGEGTAVGSMSLVNSSLDEWCIYAGFFF